MLNALIETFRRPSAITLAQRELEDAQRQLLTAQSASEYAARMVQYHQDRVGRLKRILATEAAVDATWPE